LEAARENGSAQLSFDDLTGAFVSQLRDRSTEEKAAALYKMLLELDLSLSHLGDAHEAFREKAAQKAYVREQLFPPPL
jgi:hypothetical protein